MAARLTKSPARSLMFVTALLVCLPFASAAGADTAQLEKVRTAAHEKFVRVVLDLTGPATPVLVDDGTSNGTLTIEIDTLAPSTFSRSYENLGMVRQVAFSKGPGGKTRVTFTLSDPARPRLYTYAPDFYGGDRIVIDLWPSLEARKGEEPGPTPSVAPTTDAPVPTQEEKLAALEARVLPQEKPQEEHAPLEHKVPAATHTTPATPAHDLREEIHSEEPSVNLHGESITDLSDEDGHLATAAPLKLPSLAEEKTLAEETSLAEDEGAHKEDLAESIAPALAKPQIPHTAALPVETDPHSPEGENQQDHGLIKARAIEDPLKEAERLMDKGRNDAACALLKDTFPAGSWNLPAMMMQGDCLARLGHSDQAATLYADILTFDPTITPARIRLAEAQASMGDLAAARDNFARALEETDSRSDKKALRKRIAALDKALRKNDL